MKTNLIRAALTKDLNEIIRDLLLVFSAETGLAIGLYDAEGKQIWFQHEKGLSSLCSYLKSESRIWEYCERDHSERAISGEYDPNGYAVKMCHWGLFNIGYPIIYENKFYGCLLTGQKKLDGKEKLMASEKQFNGRAQFFLDSGLISHDEKERISKSYRSVDKINNLHEPLLNSLMALEKKIIGTLSNLQKKIQNIALLRHELHDPNISVSGKLEQIIDDLEIVRAGLKNKEAENRLAHISNKVQYCYSYSRLFSAIIENIVNSVSEDKLDVKFKRVNLINLIEKAMYIFEAFAQSKKIKILPIELKKVDTRNIEMDEGLIMRVLMNAYQNAVKYSYSGHDENEPRVIVTKCENLEHHFMVSLSNYGVGILQEELKLVFAEGYRGKLASDRRRVGSGFGLFQIKKIAEEVHNGKVDITSNPLTNDVLNGPYHTTLSIYLPYYQKKERGL